MLQLSIIIIGKSKRQLMITTFAVSSMVVSNHAEVVWCFLNISERQLYFFTMLPCCFKNEGLASKLADCLLLIIVGCSVWRLHVLPVSRSLSPAPSHRPLACVGTIGDHVHLKWTSGVNVSLNACLSLYVGPTMSWQLVQNASLPEDSQDSHQPPRPC